MNNTEANASQNFVPDENFASEQEEIDALKSKSSPSEETEPSGVIDLKTQLEALTNDLQRERAEFTNFRKRAILEKTQQAAMTSSRLLQDLLPALDAFEQFFGAYKQKTESDASIKSIVDGVQLIQKQIVRVFTESGVEEFSPLGEEFDPSSMEALSMLEGDVDKEIVHQVFQKGYRIEGRLIRPARVVVMKPKAAITETNNSEGNG